MKFSNRLRAAGVSVLMLLAASQAQAASSAYATANVNLRAGPSTSYPVITQIPAGASLVDNGCLADYSWCDVSFGNNRGWLSARYMQVSYQGQRQTLSPAIAFAAGIAVTAFSASYWDNHYRAYPWYGSWGRYPVPPPPRPYLPPPGWGPPRGWGGPPPGWRPPPSYNPGWYGPYRGGHMPPPRTRYDAPPQARPAGPPPRRDAGPPPRPQYNQPPRREAGPPPRPQYNQPPVRRGPAEMHGNRPMPHMEERPMRR